MRAVSGASASSALRAEARADASAIGGLVRLAAFPATILVMVALAVLILFTPLYMHPALDLAGAPASTGLSPVETHAYSDRTVAELLFGPATFAFSAPDGSPFYDAAEIAHLRDVRAVVFGFLAVAAAAAILLAPALWRGRTNRRLVRIIGAAGGALAIGTVALGIFAAVAFSFAFELFHRLLFPGGNWAFDPTSQRLVQLYPLAFWQLTTASLGTLLIAGGGLVWWFARRRAVDGSARQIGGADA